ncbi:MAG TPA: cysteine hydrolase family protein [Luteibacter sp.]|nr:cysteine hydrolase family protein [Luteibacter sp.]
MTTALLVIDMQQALCSGEEEAFDIKDVIKRVNMLIANAKIGGAAVIFIQHEEDEGALRVDSEGWQLTQGLTVADGDVRLRKTSPDAFHRTELAGILERLGVTGLVVCGLQTDFCVDTTVRRALALGYPVVLAADAHSTIDNGVLTAAQIIAHHNRTLSNISSFGPRARVRAAADIRFPIA